MGLLLAGGGFFVLAGSLVFSHNHSNAAESLAIAGGRRDVETIASNGLTASESYEITNAPLVSRGGVVGELTVSLPPAGPLEPAPAATAVIAPEIATAVVQPVATPRPPTAVPPRPTATPAPLPPAAPVALVGLESELLTLHNTERAKSGLAPLRIDGALVEIARQRANDMASKGYFSHTSPTGDTAFGLLNRSGYAYGTAGENIARNNYPEAQVASVAMNGFMASPSHRVNVMDPRFRNVGIGSVTARDGMKYIAVVFTGQ